MNTETGNEAASASERRVFATQEEASAAVVDVAACAKRSIDIFSPTLEPGLYEGMEFLSKVKRLVLGQSYARVRVLLHDPAQAVRRGHRLVEMSRHLSSFIEIRTVHPDYQPHNEDFLVADGLGFVYRARASQWHGVADTRSRPIARRYLELFTEIWERSTAEQEFRRLHL